MCLSSNPIILNIKSALPVLAIFLLTSPGTIRAADTPGEPATINPAATPAAKQAPFEFDKQDAAAHLTTWTTVILQNLALTDPATTCCPSGAAST
jgi:hypothetical protein